MPDLDLPFGDRAPSGDRESARFVYEMIGRAQELIDTRRSEDGYPLAWYIEALYVGDLTALAASALHGYG